MVQDFFSTPFIPKQKNANQLEKMKKCVYHSRSVHMGKNCALDFEYGPQSSFTARKNLYSVFFPTQTPLPGK